MVWSILQTAKPVGGDAHPDALDSNVICGWRDKGFRSQHRPHLERTRRPQQPPQSRALAYTTNAGHALKLSCRAAELDAWVRCAQLVVQGAEDRREFLADGAGFAGEAERGNRDKAGGCIGRKNLRGEQMGS